MFTIAASALRAALPLSKAVMPLAIHPNQALHHVLFETRKDSVRITASDGETSLSQTVPAECQTPGQSAALPHKALWALIKGVKTDAPVSFDIEVTAAADDVAQTFARVKISGNNAAFKIPVHTAHFPSLGEFPSGMGRFVLTADEFRRMFSAAMHSAGAEDSRYYLHGAYLHAKQGKMISVSTDGHRMTVTDMPLPNGADFLSGGGAIVPKAACINALKVLGKGNSKVAFNYDAETRRLKIAIGSKSVLDTKAIDGTFPEYEKILERNSDAPEYFLSMDRADLGDALKLLAPLMKRNEPCVRFHFENGNLDLSPESGENNGSVVSINAVSDARKIVRGYNVRYLLDLEKVFVGEQITFRFEANDGPSLIPDDDGKTFALMPIRVTGKVLKSHEDVDEDNAEAA